MNSRRPTCPRCHRPVRTCLCHLRVDIDNQVMLTVLQHPLEQDHPKGTLPLLQLSLQRCQVYTGESFTSDQILLPDHLPILLYPAAPPSSDALISHHNQHQIAMQPNRRQLIVIDATWRKSRKILHLNPWLADLPRFALPANLPSRYIIRKNHNDQQLSTLEACCHALGELEKRAEYYTPLLQALDQFVSQYQRFTSAT